MSGQKFQPQGRLGRAIHTLEETLIALILVYALRIILQNNAGFFYAY